MKLFRYFILISFLFSFSAMSQITNDQCFTCHSNETLQKTIEVSGGTEIVPLYVNETLYNANTHGSLECVQCHLNITTANLYTHASGGATALEKTYGSWARFSKSDTTLNTDGSPRTRNYYTVASLSCSQADCHENKSEFTNSRHHTISRLKGSHLKTVNGELVGEAYDKTCSRCHTTCGTCHFKTTMTQKINGDIIAIWDSLQTLGEGPFPNAGPMSEWAMDWTANVASHEFVTPTQLTSNNDVCRSCHVGYYRPATYGYLSEEPPYPTANGTSIKRHPQYYELLQSNSHNAQTCANCHTDVHSYPDGDFDWQTQGDAKCQNCHSVANHYSQHTTVDCISCHATGFARSVGQDGHDVWRWPGNNRVRPLAVKYKEALNWYPHNIEKPDPVTSCGQKCHYDGNLLGAVTSVRLTKDIPSSFALEQNYPNPFNPNTTIKFSVPQTSYISIVVYDILGNYITKLAQEESKPGSYAVEWDGRNNFGKDVSSGIYFVRLDAGSFSASKNDTYAVIPEDSQFP
ncbi:MAG: hypothetical protein A2330_04160 [Ignavibacteria bacterium RIFOXYB2_FULL_36_7]|nr:MAG: hypothetical protein A2330_04160 [Ignavibacteria bacterium RIFOXYB2_FULL_36_7]